MPVYSSIDIDPATPSPWLPASLRGKKLKASGSLLAHQYEADTRVLAASDWVYLQVLFEAYQIHPATVAELAALGPVGGANARRWTIEGPLVWRSGDPGEPTNCVVKIEVAHSLGASPGSSWAEYRPGLYRLRSFKARLTITRPSTAYDFRVTKFATRAQRRPRPTRDSITEVFFSNG